MFYFKKAKLFNKNTIILLAIFGIIFTTNAKEFDITNFKRQDLQKSNKTENFNY